MGIICILIIINFCAPNISGEDELIHNIIFKLFDDFRVSSNPATIADFQDCSGQLEEDFRSNVDAAVEEGGGSFSKADFFDAALKKLADFDPRKL